MQKLYHLYRAFECHLHYELHYVLFVLYSCFRTYCRMQVKCKFLNHINQIKLISRIYRYSRRFSFVEMQQMQFYCKQNKDRNLSNVERETAFATCPYNDRGKSQLYYKNIYRENPITPGTFNILSDRVELSPCRALTST